MCYGDSAHARVGRPSQEEGFGRQPIHTRALIAAAIVLVCASATGVARSALVRAAGTADISVTISAPASVNEGEDVVYAVAVHNAGPDGATGVVITDQVPSGFSFDASRSNSTCSSSGTTVTCTGGPSIPAGYQLVPQIAFQTTATGSVTDTASATATQTDPTPQDNSASIDTTVNPPVSADLGVTLEGPATTDEGQFFFAQMHVSNKGPDDDNQVTVSLSVPAGLNPQFSGCVAAGTGETCSFGPFRLPRGLTEGFMLRFTSTAPGNQNLTATVASNLQDSNPMNNTAALTVNVQQVADLALGANAAPNPVVAGHQVTATIVLTNGGPSPATSPLWNTSWSSDSKGGVDFESMSSTSGTCSLSGTSISCRPGDLANGQQIILTIVLQPRSKGTLVIDSSATSSVFDPHTANNSVETSVTIS